MDLTLMTLDSPLGEMTVVHRGETLVALEFSDRWNDERRAWRRASADPPRTTRRPRFADAIAAYWAGDLQALDRLEVAPEGTPFQMRVWKGLRTIPVGTTLAYSELAERVGASGAARAVGTANGRNPISLVIPCHRVIGADGTLHGYGGGIERKRALLAHEGVTALAMAV
jgi:methylated-DNA-[protein]-cysteine S-methyltransferase